MSEKLDLAFHSLWRLFFQTTFYYTFMSEPVLRIWKVQSVCYIEYSSKETKYVSEILKSYFLGSYT